MLREVNVSDLETVYQETDRVQLDTKGCQGCSYCCEHVGRSIVLDPLDLFRLTQGTNRSYEELRQTGILEVHIVDGLMLPNLSVGEETGCSFLSAEKRCRIHPYRPGFCRLFPLARVFRDGDYAYLVQSGQCRKPLTGEVPIQDWLSEENPDAYHDFILSWHDLRRQISDRIPHISMRAQRMLGTYLLRKFYGTPYTGEDFYPEYQERLRKAREVLEEKF